MRLQYVIFLGIITTFAFLNGFLGAQSGIDNWAHLGGLIYGILITPLILPPLIVEGETEENKLKEQVKHRKMRLLSIVGLAVINITFIVALFTRPLPLCDSERCNPCY